MTTLTRAFNEWSTRPADERFSSLEDLHAATTHHRDVSVEATQVPLKSLRVEVSPAVPTIYMPSSRGDEATDAQPVLVGSSGKPASFTHYAFGQLARNVGAPASYLRTLPAALVAENLNHGIAQAEATDNNLLFTANGDLRLRAMVSQQYKRIWNADVTSRLLRLVEQQPEWQPAPAAFDGSRGLYASDEDMFAFLVDNDRRIFESLPGGGLGRGFFVWNSEVGAASFGIMTFFYEYVCGNHRVWGAKGVQELRIRHVGNADDRAFAQLSAEIRKYADSSATEDEAKVTAMRSMVLGESKDTVLDAVFGLKNVDLSRKLIEASYDKAVEREDWYGNPRTVWGLTGGMTEIARDMPNANERVKLERAAGKIMQIAF